MLTASALYRRALPYPWRRVCRVDVYHAGVFQGSIDSTTPLDSTGGAGVVSGTVQVALNNRVTRVLDLVVHPSLFPDAVDSLLSPYRSVVRVFSGIGYPDGSSELFPVFTGRVEEAAQDGSGSVGIAASDLAADVVLFPFETPQNSGTGFSVVEQIRTLITQAIPDAEFGTDDVTDQQVPKLTWDTDRGAALDDLAQAVQGRWYTLGDGSFVVRRYPYTAGTPVLDLADASGGTLMKASRTISRDGAVNSVSVVSERIDGTDPVHVTVRDLDVGSPTYFGGPYGRVSRITKIQTPLNQSQCLALALEQLSASTALSEQWSVTCTPDATLEAGDTIRLSYRGAHATQVIDRITYPLVDGSMTLQTRSSVTAKGSTL